MDTLDFFVKLSAVSESSLSPKAQKARQNVMKWPSHITKGPLLDVVGILLDEQIPAPEKGFPPFSIRRCTGGAMEERFGEDALVMCLPKYGDANQAGVTAETLRNKLPSKHAVYWDERESVPATREEVAQFLTEAFGI